MAARDEADLARRARLGDRDAFAALVDLVGPGLYRYAVRMVSDPGEAEDCVQDALARAWVGLDAFRGEARVRTWLFGIQANVVRHHLRTRRPMPVADERLDRPDQVGPAQEALAADLREALDRALGSLPATQREAWLLVAVEELSYREAARALGMTEGALRGNLERARRTLEEGLRAWR